MDFPTTTRRNLLRTGLTAGGVALAGCSGPLGGSGGEGTLDRVPADARLVFHADVAALLEDDVLRDRIEELAAEAGPVGASQEPGVSAFLDEFETEAGLDPRQLEDALLFAGYEADAPAGLLVRSGWAESDLREAMDDAGAEAARTEYAGHTVYDVDDAQLGVLAEGQYVVGQRGGAEAAIDVANGDADSVSGRVRDGFQAAADGAVRLSFDVPDAVAADVGADAMIDREVVEAVTHGYGAYAVDGADRVLTLAIETESADAAEQLAAVARTGLSMARSQIDAGAGDEQMAAEAEAMLDSVEVEQRDTAVGIRVGRGEDALAIGLVAIIGTFVLGFGSSQTQRVAPTAAFDLAYEPDAGTVTVTHAGGDSIRAGELSIRGTGFAEAPQADLTGPGRWVGSASGSLEGQPAVVAGDSVAVGVEPDYVVRVVWEDADGGTAATLAVDRGPDA